MRKAVIAAIIWLAGGSASMPQDGVTPITATPIAIDPADPAHRDFGRLHFLAGWVLTSRQPGFGGYSALNVDGDRFLALADTGEYMRFRMTRPGVISEAHFGVLPNYPGRTGTKGDRDSESMAVDPVSRSIWVGFEGYNAIFRYTRDFGRALAATRPIEMRGWPVTTGAESLARLSDGRFVILSEDAPLADGAKAALLFPGDPTDPHNQPIRFAYRPPAGYVATHAAELPDGRLIVLNRHFRVMDGFWAALTIIDPRDVTSGQELYGEKIAEFRRPLNIDNMEGISVVREGGRTILWLISDDNQLPVQRTLLLKFALN